MTRRKRNGSAVTADISIRVSRLPANVRYAERNKATLSVKKIIIDK